MNRSGLSAKQLMSFFKFSPADVLIAHDELDIAPGALRLKFGGGHGGHNGLRDLHAQLGADYWRLRIGIGHPGDRNKVVDYVLSRPTQNEEIEIMRSIDLACDEIERIVQGDMQIVMNTLHSK
jgi:PTH1 family peptidyl-tRNA hydrolase